jgi:hypothetical protein
VITLIVTNTDREAADQVSNLTIVYFATDSADLGAIISDVSITAYDDLEPMDIIVDGIVVAEGYEGTVLTSGR